MGADGEYSTCSCTPPNGHWITVYSMLCMSVDYSTDAVILVDARNIFKPLNHQAALYNIRVICPQIAAILSTHITVQLV